MDSFRRSAKYFCLLCVLCLGVMALESRSGHSALSLGEHLRLLVRTPRGLRLLGAAAVLAGLYPRFGFVRRCVEGDLGLHREQVLRALRSAGFSLRSEQEGVLTFRADTLPHRLVLLGEDEIKVSQHGSCIAIEGLRRVAVRIAYRLDSYLRTMHHE